MGRKPPFMSLYWYVGQALTRYFEIYRVAILANVADRHLGLALFLEFPVQQCKHTTIFTHTLPTLLVCRHLPHADLTISKSCKQALPDLIHVRHENCKTLSSPRQILSCCADILPMPLMTSLMNSSVPEHTYTQIF